LQGPRRNDHERMPWLNAPPIESVFRRREMFGDPVNECTTQSSRRTDRGRSLERQLVTTPVQTALDLAATQPFLRGVVAADQTLWTRRPGGALVTSEHLFAGAASYRGRGTARLQRVAEFVRSGADSVRETQSRVLIARMGFPQHELQHRFTLPSGRVV